MLGKSASRHLEQLKHTLHRHFHNILISLIVSLKILFGIAILSPHNFSAMNHYAFHREVGNLIDLASKPGSVVFTAHR